jgi:ABC-2 type transport system ATP-binding protein
MPLIEAVQLTKSFRSPDRRPGIAGAMRHVFAPRYSEKAAVEDLDLAIEPGESVAYVGPNGAGKSTTIKMLTGILVPTAGKLRVNGLVPHRQRIENAKGIGVVFGQRTQLWWDIPVRDSFALHRKIYEIPDAVFRENLARFTRLLGLDEFQQLTARKISLGQRMRADLAMALLHNPRILYLDEPTIGLDLTAKEAIRAFIKELNRERGITLILTTHDLDDIEEICRRLVILDRGRKIYDGDLETVKDRFARERVIRFQLETPCADLTTRLAGLTAAGIAVEADGDRRFALRFDRLRHTAGLLTREVMKHAAVMDIHLEEPSIEQVIRQVYAGKLSETPAGAATAAAEAAST